MAEEIKDQEAMIAQFKQHASKLKHYKKKGIFKYRILKKAEKIVTEINGEVETTYAAKKGDYVMTGSAGETYVLTPDKFETRYKVVDDETAEATGECWAFPWFFVNETFIASWGEEMIIKAGDYLVSPNPEFTEVYRIELNVFNDTYVLVQ